MMLLRLIYVVNKRKDFLFTLLKLYNVKCKNVQWVTLETFRSKYGPIKKKKTRKLEKKLEIIIRQIIYKDRNILHT